MGKHWLWNNGIKSTFYLSKEDPVRTLPQAIHRLSTQVKNHKSLEDGQYLQLQDLSYGHSNQDSMKDRQISGTKWKGHKETTIITVNWSLKRRKDNIIEQGQSLQQIVLELLETTPHTHKNEYRHRLYHLHKS